MTLHGDVCSGSPRPVYDRDSGRHTVGYSCGVCGRRWDRGDRERHGVTYRYPVRTPRDDR